MAGLTNLAKKVKVGKIRLVIVKATAAVKIYIIIKNTASIRACHYVVKKAIEVKMLAVTFFAVILSSKNFTA